MNDVLSERTLSSGHQDPYSHTATVANRYTKYVYYKQQAVSASEWAVKCLDQLSQAVS